MKHKSFILMWVGQLLSNIGSGLTMFVLGIYVFKLTGSATQYALLMLAASLPSLLLRPIGGTLSDRVDRRLLMIVGDCGAAFGVAFICLMMWLGVTALWPIYVGSILSSIFVAFHNPACKASVTDLVDKEFYAKASGLMQLAEVSKILIAPIIASLLFLVMDIQQILLLDIVTFILGIVPLSWLRQQHKTNREPTNASFIKDLILGYQYLINNKAVLSLLLITSLLTFFVGVLQALLGPLILAIAGEKVLGIVQTIITSGMLVGGGLIGILGRPGHHIKTLSIGLLCAGLFFALIGSSSLIVCIVSFGFLFCLTLPLVNTSLDVLIRSNVDNQMQGRIWSMVSLISQSGMLVAFGLAGYWADNVFSPLLMPDGLLADSIGKFIGVGPGRGIGCMFILSGFCMMGVGFIIHKLPGLRRLEQATLGNIATVR